jgi:hypothetical protein
MKTSTDVRPTIVRQAFNLQLGAKSLALTLSSGVGSCPIPDGTKEVWIKPSASAACRVGLEAPEADGAKTGNAALSDLKKGIPVDDSVWTKFIVSPEINKTLYVKGASAGVLEIVMV